MENTKIKNPKTGYLINIGGKTYNKLLEEGYLKPPEKIKSPATKRLITVGGQKYKELYKKGYFKQLTGNIDLDKVILLELDMNNLNNININKYTNQILNDNHFWCQWLYKHMNIKSNKDCKFISIFLNNEKYINSNFILAAKKGYDSVIEVLLKNNMIKDSDTFYVTLISAITNNHLNIVKTLLSNYKYDKNKLSNILEDTIKDLLPQMIIELINNGAVIYNDTVLQAAYASKIDSLKLILSYAPDLTITDSEITTMLGLRQYKRLRLLLNHRNYLPKEIKNKAIQIINEKKYKALDELLMPYITDIFYEIRYKWFGQLIDNIEEELPNDENYEFEYYRYDL